MMIHQFSRKVVLAGDAGVGKSSALYHAMSGEQTNRYVPTIGASLTPLTYDIEDVRITLNVWDTAGNPAYECLPDGYYIEANGVIIVADNPNRYLDRVVRMCPDARIIHVRPDELDDSSFTKMARLFL